ncbi:MAG: metal-dependent cyclase [Porticoccaceae bacterium]|nr:MAG: metal-dependent cyclase [Porticoccaceae bacterium]
MFNFTWIRQRKITTSILLIAGLSLFSGITTAGDSDVSGMNKLQKDAPKNWGKWGDDDQVGALNYLDNAQVLRGVATIKTGQRFTLQIPMTHGFGPVFPGRVPVQHFMSQDQSVYSSGKIDRLSGGMKYSDDAVFMYLQGTTHVDALGHAWYNNEVYNGKSADTTIHGHNFVDIGQIGEKAIVGRGVLLDVGKLLGDKNGRLAPNTCINLPDLKKTAEAQSVTIEKRDILLIRTGSMGRFYDKKDHDNWNALTEPGLCYSKDLIHWLNKMEIPVIASDNLAIEKAAQTIDGESFVIPLHGALIRDLGIVLSEIYWLDELAASSAKDGRYSFFFSAAPLKMKGGTGAPVNPIVIK